MIHQRHPARPADATTTTTAGTVAMLDDADRLWRGPALDGFAARPWARPLAGQLERRRLDARADRLDALLSGDRPRQVADEARALLARFPREARLWSLLVIAHDRSGKHALALRTVRRARRVLGAGAIAPVLAMDQLEQALLERTSLPTPAAAMRQVTCGSTGPPRS